MLFSKDDERTNERVLYKTKPNMILGCKKVIYGVVLLAIVFYISPVSTPPPAVQPWGSRSFVPSSFDFLYQFKTIFYMN